MRPGEVPDSRSGRDRYLFAFLGAVSFATAIGNLGLVSVMPLIGRAIGIPDYLVASVFSLSALAWAVSSPFWTGAIAGRGVNRFIRAGLLGFILSMGGCALAVALGVSGAITPLASFACFFVLRAIFGLLGSASAIATQALVALSTSGQQRTRVLTSLAGALSLGTIVGPTIAPLAIVPPLGLTGPMALFASLGLAAYVATYFFLPHSGRVRPAEAAKARGPSIRSVWWGVGSGPALTFGLLLCSAQAINLYTIGFVLLDRVRGVGTSAQNLIGATMTAGAVMALLAQWGLPRFVRLQPGAMMAAGALLSIFGNGFALVDAAPLTVSAGFAVACFGYGLARPGFSAAASLGGTNEEQVAIASATSLIAGASIILPPVVATAAYGAWRDAPFAIPIGLLLACFAVIRFGPIVFRER